MSERERKSMLIRDAKWEAVRGQFTEEEKASLRKAMTGSVICPAGIVIDPDVLSPKLRAKITAAVK